MTEQQKEVLKYKDYPEGSGGKAIYDSLFLTFQDFLIKYYKAPSETKKTSWDRFRRWQQKYIEPAFDESRHEEMIKNFGYVSIDKHDFKSQYAIYDKLKSDKRLDEETRMFIGFMAGAGFFKNYKISLEGWFEIENWSNPSANLENTNGRKLNDILDYEYGLNFLKVDLSQIPFWKR